MSVSSPLLKELKGHILSLIRPPVHCDGGKSYAIRLPDASSHPPPPCLAAAADPLSESVLSLSLSENTPLLAVDGTSLTNGAPNSCSVASEGRKPSADTEILLRDDVADLLRPTSDSSSPVFSRSSCSLVLTSGSDRVPPVLPSTASCASARPVFPRVDESHPSLEPLCRTIEHILNDGLQGGQHTPFGYIRTSYWDWMSSLKDIGSAYSDAVQAVSVCRSVRGAVARGRLLIRHTLVHGCLHHPLRNKEEAVSLYSPDSVLGHEILSEILMSLVRQLDLVQFKLELGNTYFLEESWRRPLVRQVILNPKQELGLHLGHVSGWCVVMSVDVASAAHVTGQVHTGDVIVTMNGSAVRGLKRQGVTSLLRQASHHTSGTQPSLRLGVLQGIDGRGSSYPPLLPLLQRLGVDVEELGDRQHSDPPANTAQLHQDDDRDQQKGCLEFIGSVDVGSRGDMSLLEGAIDAVLARAAPPIPVSLMTGEMGVRVTPVAGGQPLFRHSYTEISACGRRADSPRYFAYIAGSTSCNLADNFTCYVFRAPSEPLCADILLTLADGFHRTHWAV